MLDIGYAKLGVRCLISFMLCSQFDFWHGMFVKLGGPMFDISC